MTDFEIVVLTVSLILGLGVAQILSGFAASVRDRAYRRPHWLPLSWGLLVLLLHVLYFFVLLDVQAAGLTWTWSRYGPVLLYVVLLFMSGSLLFPTRLPDAPEDQLDDFVRHGRFGLVPLTASLLLSCPMNVQAGGEWLSLPNAVNVALVVIGLVVLLTGRPTVRVVGTLAFAAGQVFGMLFAWTNPGVRAPFS